MKDMYGYFFDPLFLHIWQCALKKSQQNKQKSYIRIYSYPNEPLGVSSSCHFTHSKLTLLVHRLQSHTHTNAHRHISDTPLFPTLYAHMVQNWAWTTSVAAVLEKLGNSAVIVCLTGLVPAAAASMPVPFEKRQKTFPIFILILLAGNTCSTATPFLFVGYGGTKRRWEHPLENGQLGQMWFDWCMFGEILWVWRTKFSVIGVKFTMKLGCGTFQNKLEFLHIPLE